MKRKASNTKQSGITHADLEEMLISTVGRIQGSDTDDNEYDSILKLWNKELKPSKGKKSAKSEAEIRASESVWYSKAFNYWENEKNCPISDGKVSQGDMYFNYN